MGQNDQLFRVSYLRTSVTLISSIAFVLSHIGCLCITGVCLKVRQHCGRLYIFYFHFPDHPLTTSYPIICCYFYSVVDMILQTNTDLNQTALSPI